MEKISSLSDETYSALLKKLEILNQFILIGNKAKDLSLLLGTILNLTLIKNIIDLYKGKIRVEDKVQGDYSPRSNFIFLIPEMSGV